MSPGEYRQNAARCMAVAETLPEGSFKQSLREMAAAWMRLAAQAEKNLTADLVYETPPPRPQQSPIATQQQQQQIQPKPDDKEKE
jgi:hypothetical protein